MIFHIIFIYIYKSLTFTLYYIAFSTFHSNLFDTNFILQPLIILRLNQLIETHVNSNLLQFTIYKRFQSSSSSIKSIFAKFTVTVPKEFQKLT